MGNPAGGGGEVSSMPALNDYERTLVANVREHGCQVVSVFDPEGKTPPFSYSVGFWETVGEPEVIIFGLNGDMGHFAVNEVLRQCRAGLALVDGQLIEGLLEEYDVICMARAVDPRSLTPEYFNSALWYHRYRTGDALRVAVQLVWPDEGIWPWEQGATAEFLEEQPVLYHGKLN
jgi:hypothetical protein